MMHMGCDEEFPRISTELIMLRSEVRILLIPPTVLPVQRLLLKIPLRAEIAGRAAFVQQLKKSPQLTP